jgi:hypothetical protein
MCRFCRYPLFTGVSGVLKFLGIAWGLHFQMLFIEIIAEFLTPPMSGFLERLSNC